MDSQVCSVCGSFGICGRVLDRITVVAESKSLFLSLSLDRSWLPDNFNVIKNAKIEIF